jgi:hypothetical protein
MTDERLRQAYARHLASLPPGGRERCVPPEALLALAQREGTEAERVATLDHAMVCDACRRDLELFRSVARAGAATAGTRRVPRWFSPQLAAAAAVLLVVGGSLAVLVLRRTGETALRGGTRDIVLVSPEGSVPAGEAVTLVWRGAGGGVRYEVELLSATGDSIYATATTDTALTLPGSVALAAGGEYVWSVRAVLPDGRQAGAVPRRFRVSR